MSPDSYVREVEFAVRAATEAARLCRQVGTETQHGALRKPDASPVTVADFASQALISAWLSESFPDDTLIAEEDARLLRQSPDVLEEVAERVRRVRPDAGSADVCTWIDRGRGALAGRTWVLDPIDGTKGFARGDQYVVALALLVEGEAQMAVLAAPNLGPSLRTEPSSEGAVLQAVRGEGAWSSPLDGGRRRRLEVSSRNDARQARVLRSYEDVHTDVRVLEGLSKRLGIRRQWTLMDSQAKYAVIAGGHADLLFRLVPATQPEYKEKLWDVTAGSLIVQEAGGRVTDLEGRRLDLTTGRELTHNRGVLVSNGHLHDAGLAAVAAIEGRTP